MEANGIPDLEALDVRECLELLGRCSVGRLALNGPLGPLVVPVNYVLDGDVIVFRTDDGTKLGGIDVGPVSFQVDWFDELHEVGWSVLVRGTAREVGDEELAHLHLRPWAAGEKRHWVRLAPGLVTGRRISRIELPFDARGYR